MALVSCRECGKKISDSTNTCPQCGAKQRVLSKSQVAYLAWGIVFIVFASFFNYVGIVEGGYDASVLAPMIPLYVIGIVLLILFNNSKKKSATKVN